ncbi:MAG: BatD family protein [Polyangiaceae bacterium]|nr:BatD family protein [Polyangiaceae bacterium]
MSTMRFVSACTAAMAIASASQVAFAEPQLKTRISTTRPEVGEPFTIQLSALVSPGEPIPSDPVLKPPRGATIMGGPSVGQSMVVINGVAQVGIDATWQLVANAPAKVKIPAPTVLWAGRRFSGQAVDVEVVRASGRPKRSTNPFLLPGGPGFGGFGFPFGGFEPEETLPPIDGSLELRTAPDPYVFVHARADKKTAVVGEQITVTFYIYRRISTSVEDRHDPTAADFLRFSMLANPGAEPIVRAKAGGQTYDVITADRIALFPVRTGDLHVGSLQFAFTGRPIGRRSARASEDLVIRVTEPPRVGRPAGYVLGDVGRFSLTANVEPRRIPFGGTLAVTARVSGNGNFPQSLKVPERTGVEWLDPEKRESIGAQGGIIAGYRSFGYVVRVKESGNVNLGKIDLPHWDPASRKYQVASVDLGTVEVLPEKQPPPSSPHGASSASTEAAATDKAPADPFANIPGVRTTLGTYTPPPAPVFEGPRLFVALGAPPIAYALFSAGLASARRIRLRRQAGAVSPERLAKGALDDADRARSSGDAKAVCAAIERALHHALKAATDLETRGILLDDLPGELETAGLSEDLATRTKDLFDEVSALRFDPDASDASVEELMRRGKSLVQEVLDNPAGDRG